MVGAGRPGVEPLVAERDLFLGLIAAGMSNSEAWRQVGVNRRTGTRWRYGRSVPTADGGLLHYPPVDSSRAAVISSRYLSEDERILIADLHRAGLSSRAIAEQVRRSPSTISRELARNSQPDGQYGAAQAHRLAAGRRRRVRARRLETDVVLRIFVQQCTDVRWRPGADQPCAGGRVPRPAAPAAGPGKPVPGALRHQAAAHPDAQDPAVAPPSSPAPPARRPHGRPARRPDGHDRRPAGRGRRPGRGGPLGG